MALKDVAENLKRELSGLVDDIYLNETAVSATFADGEANRETASLLSELRSVTAECVQGRRDFSEKVGESRREASENLVSILKKEISFLTRKLNRELGERQNFKSQIAQLEGERLVLEEQSRRIEQDIQEASESNAKLEVAMGKTKRLVTSLRDSIDWANMIGERTAVKHTDNAASTPPTIQEQEEVQEKAAPKPEEEAPKPKEEAPKPKEDAPKPKELSKSQKKRLKKKKAMEEKKKLEAALKQQAAENDTSKSSSKEGEHVQESDVAASEVSKESSPPSSSPIPVETTSGTTSATFDNLEVSPEPVASVSPDMNNVKISKGLSQAKDTIVSFEEEKDTDLTEQGFVNSPNQENKTAKESTQPVPDVKENENQNKVDHVQQPAQFEDNFGSSTDLWGSTTATAVSEAVPAPMQEAPAPADVKENPQPAQFEDNFGSSTDLWGSTTATAVSEAVPAPMQEAPAPADVKENENQNKVDHVQQPAQFEDNFGSSTDLWGSTTATAVSEAVPAPMQEAPAPADVKENPQPAQFEDNFGSSTDLWGSTTATAVSEAVPAPMQEAPAPADVKENENQNKVDHVQQPAQFEDNFGSSTDLWGSTTATAVSEAVPAPMQEAPAPADVKENENQNKVDHVQQPAQFEDNFGSSTDLWGSTTATAVSEAVPAPMQEAPAPADVKENSQPAQFEDNFGSSTDLWGSTATAALQSDQKQDNQNAPTSDDFFGMAPAQAEPAQQWQDMDLFEPVDMQASESDFPTSNVATITVSGKQEDTSFDPNSWIDFGNPPANSSPPKENQTMGVGQAPAADSTWAQFDSPPQFWNDLPAPNPPETIQFSDQDMLPSSNQINPADQAAQNHTGQGFEVDFFNTAAPASGTGAPSASAIEQPQQQQQFAVDFGAEKGIEVNSTEAADTFAQNSWVDDPFKSEEANFPKAPSKNLRSMSEIEIQKCDQAFTKLVGAANASASKEELHKYYSLTQLPEAIFSKIWVLTDPRNLGRVSLQQFYLFMYFMTAAVKGNDLPQSLSEEDIAVILGGRDVAVASSSSAPTQTQPVGDRDSNSPVAQLMGLGFPESEAKSALVAVGGGDVAAAANYLLGDSPAETSRFQGQPQPSSTAGVPIPSATTSAPPAASSASAAPASSQEGSLPSLPSMPPVSLALLQISSDVSKVASRIFVQMKVLAPDGTSLEQNNMVEVRLGSKGNFARIDRSISFVHSFASLAQNSAKILFEVKKEKKRSFVSKAWGCLDILEWRDVVEGPNSQATGNDVRIHLSSKPIDPKTYKSKKSAVKGSSSQLHLKFNW